MSFQNPADNWTTSGNNILNPDTLFRLRQCLEQRGPVVVEHWFYYCGRSPDRLVFDDYLDLEAYLVNKAAPGDIISAWEFDAVCRDYNMLVSGKRPDDEGRVPETGAY